MRCSPQPPQRPIHDATSFSNSNTGFIATAIGPRFVYLLGFEQQHRSSGSVCRRRWKHKRLDQGAKQVNIERETDSLTNSPANSILSSPSYTTDVRPLFRSGSQTAASSSLYLKQSSTNINFCSVDLFSFSSP